MPTQKHNESPADFVRRQGWKVGTIITGTEVYVNGRTHVAAIEITAIGIGLVAAQTVHPTGERYGECPWTLRYRNWVEVGR